jgi:hypothetical protein
VIRGYRAVLDPERVGLAICAFVHIAPQPRKPAQDLVERLLGLPEVEELHAVAGNYAYVAKVRVATPAALDEFLDRLFMLEGVERTETTMVLRTNAERPMFLPFLEDDAAAARAVSPAAHDRVLGRPTPDLDLGYLRLREGSFGYPGRATRRGRLPRAPPELVGAFVGGDLAAASRCTRTGRGWRGRGTGRRLGGAIRPRPSTGAPATSRA